MSNYMIIEKDLFKKLKLNNDKPDVISIILYSELMERFRSASLVEDPDERGLILTKMTYEDINNLFGFSEKQARESLKRLEVKGLVKREFLDFKTDYGTLVNVMHISVDLQNIRW